jgi:hypothetical protein
MRLGCPFGALAGLLVLGSRDTEGPSSSLETPRLYFRRGNDEIEHFYRGTVKAAS